MSEYGDIHAAVEVLDPKPPRKGSALTCAAPAAGATGEVLLAWLTDQLRLPVPLVRVERFGAHAESVVVLTLKDGSKLRFAAQRELMDAAKLVQTVVFSLGERAPQLPVFTKADAQDVGTVVVRACQATAAEDAGDEAREWAAAFAAITLEVDCGDYDDPAVRWGALVELDRFPVFDSRWAREAASDPQFRARALRWLDGRAFVRVRDYSAFVRGACGAKLSVQQLHSRMAEVGWAHQVAQTWRPGAERSREHRVSLAVYVPDAEWGS